VPETITSRHHPIVKAFKAAARGGEPSALVDGWHLLAEAVAAHLDIEMVAIAGEPPDADSRRLIRQLPRSVHVVPVSADAMRALSPVRTPTGVAALVARRGSSLDRMLAVETPFVVIAVDLQDPGNAGAVVRAAEAGGASGVVFAGASADPWGWKALRASMGSTFRLPVIRSEDAGAICEELTRARVRILAAAAREGTSIYQADLARASALLLGGEGPGLPLALRSRADEVISIPMAGPVESLNVAVAAGVIVYEAARQRREISATARPTPASSAR